MQKHIFQFCYKEALYNIAVTNPLPNSLFIIYYYTNFSTIFFSK